MSFYFLGLIFLSINLWEYIHVVAYSKNHQFYLLVIFQTMNTGEFNFFSSFLGLGSFTVSGISIKLLPSLELKV